MSTGFLPNHGNDQQTGPDRRRDHRDLARGFVPFPDHAAYSAETMRFLTDRAAVYDAGLVTTVRPVSALAVDLGAE